MFNNNLLRKDRLVMGIFFIVISTIFVFVCSTTTSPFLGTPVSGDSAMFQIIGKYWSKGKMPYIGLWDSKGPFIFFINALGYSIINSSLGVLLIQIINLTVIEIFIYKIYRIEFSKQKSFFLLIISLITLIYPYEGGNLTEEYVLSFITISFFLLFKWCDSVKLDKVDHNPKWSFFYGACFSLCFLTRITNAIGVCIGIGIVFIYLVIKRRWKNIIYNTCYFILGFMIFTLPFILYFYLNGILEEMLYGTIFYNIDYAGVTNFRIGPTSIKGFIVYLNTYGLCLVGIIILITNKKERISGIMWTIIGGVTHIWLLKCLEYSHYIMISLPYFCISIVELHRIYINQRHLFVKRIIGIMIIYFIFIGLVGGTKGLKTALTSYYNYYTMSVKESQEAIDVMVDMYNKIPNNEKKSFVAYNCESGLYLKLDVCPYYRFFTLQDWAASRSETLPPKIQNTFMNGNVEWILVSDYGYVGIQKILDERYKCIGEREVLNSTYKLKLYHLK